jgi:plastocyanin
MAFAVLVASAAVLLTISVASAPVTRAQTPAAAPQGRQSWSVLVDNVSPANHVWGFDAYYPNNLEVHAGDTVTFNTALNPNAFHTVALLPAGVTPEKGFPGYVIGDDDEPGMMLFPFFANEPATPCGRAGQSACAFDGKAALNSGIMTLAPPPEAGGGQGNPSFTVNIGANVAPGTYFFECYVHGPAMSGSIDVLPGDAPTQTAADVQADAKLQYQTDLESLSAGEVAISVPTTKANGDGTTTWGVAAGGSAPNPRVTVNEFGVKQLVIKAGDTVNWTMQSGPPGEVHTVTGFAPAGQEPPEADAFDIACEGPGAQDTFAPEQGFPLDFWSTCPGREESHATQYALASDPTGAVYTSGLRNSGIMLSPDFPEDFGPFLGSYSVKFTRPGVYNYHCTIHDGMDASVVVLPGG